ncbi:thioredoxin domain-containing 3 -like protein, partial [Brachionus plicatilis]
MARRKVEIVLQQEIETDEQWNTLLANEGLIVIDVYQSYGGPLRAMESRFRALKNTLGDDKLHFAIAKADTINALEDYRGRSEPCFLFYAGKELVSVVRGANAPLIVRSITEQLEQEHKVLKGEAQRKPIIDQAIEKIKKKKAEEKSKEQVQHLIKTKRPLTICIIKPDMIAKNKKDEIIQKIKDKGYEIVEQRNIQFTEKMAQQFYAHKKDDPHFDDLIRYMTSDESCVLALTKESNQEDVINNWRKDIGADIEEPQENPDSFRGQYATDKLMNAIHGSDSHESATRELAFFFPDYENSENKQNLQRTLALIRPSAFTKHHESIVKKIQDKGFRIAMSKTVQLSVEQAEQFYADHKGRPYFDDLVKEMTSGKMMVLCLAKEDAIQSWRSLLGPKEKEKLKEAAGTLRNEFDVDGSPINALHGPSSQEQAKKEIETFFPMEQTVAILKPGISPEKREEIKKKIEKFGFIIATKKSDVLSQEIAKEMYKNASDKEYYNDLINLMSSGETEIMVLSRENAIQGWKEVIGPTDPEKAKQENPESLRALYGIDVLKNAVHGPTTQEQAEHEIKLFFGDIKFDKS